MSRSRRSPARFLTASVSSGPCSERVLEFVLPMIATLDSRSPLLPGRFGFLMGLYAENYHRLARLFAPQGLSPGRYVSDVDDGLNVHLHLQECHPYTLE